MAQARVYHTLNDKQVSYILHSPNGPVARDLIKRGIRVQTRARRNLGGNTGSGPKRVDTGLLRASIATQLRTDGVDLVMRVGTNVFYSRWVHDGTGIFGPRARPIRPKVAKFMRWYNKQGKPVFAKQTKGMKPNPFLRDALPAYRASSSA
jgi:hypothetical protein